MPATKRCHVLVSETICVYKILDQSTLSQFCFSLFHISMGKANNLSDFGKGQIVLAKRLGKSISKTPTLVVCSGYAVISTCQRWSPTGHTLIQQQGVGRPCLIDARGQCRLSHLQHQEGYITCNFSHGDGPNIAIHHMVLNMGLCGHSPIHVSMLTAVHRHQCIQWAHSRRHWTIND